MDLNCYCETLTQVNNLSILFSSFPLSPLPLYYQSLPLLSLYPIFTALYLKAHTGQSCNQEGQLSLSHLNSTPNDIPVPVLSNLPDTLETVLSCRTLDTLTDSCLPSSTLSRHPSAQWSHPISPFLYSRLLKDLRIYFPKPISVNLPLLGWLFPMIVNCGPGAHTPSPLSPADSQGSVNIHNLSWASMTVTIFSITLSPSNSWNSS